MLVEEREDVDGDAASGDCIIGVEDRKKRRQLLEEGTGREKSVAARVEVKERTTDGRLGRRERR